MSLNSYSDYKNAGVEWLGLVPECWALGKLKNLLMIKGGQDYKLVETDDEAAIPVIGSGGQFTYATDYLYDGESVLLGRKGTIDKPLYIHGKFWTVDTMFYSEMRGRASAKYAFYLATTIPFGFYSTSTALPSMSQFDLSNHQVAIPSITEQTQIARFLDHEVGKIDALIAEQEKLIALLKEKRQAVISHAVTKGLNPDAPMKDSGVEWLGQVPEHWVVSALKYKALLNPSKSSFGGSKEQECSFIPMEKLKTDTLVLDEVRTIEDVFAGYTYFEDGDVLIAKVTPCFENKNIAIARNLENGIGFGSSEIYVVRPVACNTRFLFYRLREDAFMAVCTAAMTGAGGLKRVPSELLQNFTFAFPDASEQQRIAEYLDSICDKYSILQSEAEAAIELFKERRSALISAAVTGKIDVRGWQPPAAQ